MLNIAYYQEAHTVWLHHFSDAKTDLGSSDAGLTSPLTSFSSTLQLMFPLGGLLILLNTDVLIPSFFPRLLVEKVKDQKEKMPCVIPPGLNSFWI